MAITPQTNIKLLHIPFDLSTRNTLSFSGENQQHDYFWNLAGGLEIDECSYQRKENRIRVNQHIDTLYNYNYVMYQNENYSQKWFYAFIIGKEYVNDNMTYVYIQTDAFMTWQHRIDFMETFVEREMCNVADDIPGFNLVPEDVEIGEPILSNDVDSISLFRPVYVIAYTRDPYADGFTSDPISSKGFVINGVPTGLYFKICSKSNLNPSLTQINNAGHGDAIMNVFTIPVGAVLNFKSMTEGQLVNNANDWITNDFMLLPPAIDLGSKPSSINSYTPKNAKLLTYPYTYLAVNPSQGSQNIYRYEDFDVSQTDNKIKFEFYSEINPNPSVYLTPLAYKNRDISLQNASVLSGYPTIGWVTDYFNTYLAQNSGLMQFNLQRAEFEKDVANVRTGMSGIKNTLSNVLSKSLLGSAITPYEASFEMQQNEMNYGFQVGETLKQIEKQKLLPNQATASSSNCTLLGYLGINSNVFVKYEIKRQFAKRIDDYFSMYGYQTNEIKIPNIDNRPNWNYIKTIGCNIDGFIPPEDKAIIENQFNNGITIWHNPTTFLDYSQNNK